MRLWLGAVLIILIIIYGLHYIWMQREPQDTVDYDFVATLQKTNDPYVFEVVIQKVNKNVDKKIGGFAAIVDLALTHSSGKVYSAESWESALYATEITDIFGMPISPTDSLKGKVRLIRRDIPPGHYIIQPRVRIYETGKDRLRGNICADSGSVLVPAGNSIKVEVKPPWLVKPLEDPKDVVDSDFVATIALTNISNVFLIEVKRTNKNVDKTINSHHDVFVDLELIDEKSRVYKGDFQIKTFAEDVSDELAANDASPFPTSRKGRVRLITTNLSPGTYTIKPNVRIVEEGKDRIENPRAIAGSVKIPAGNSIKVTVSK